MILFSALFTVCLPFQIRTFNWVPLSMSAPIPISPVSIRTPSNKYSIVKVSFQTATYWTARRYEANHQSRNRLVVKTHELRSLLPYLYEILNIITTIYRSPYWYNSGVEVRYVKNSILPHSNAHTVCSINEHPSLKSTPSPTRPLSCATKSKLVPLALNWIIMVDGILSEVLQYTNFSVTNMERLSLVAGDLLHKNGRKQEMRDACFLRLFVKSVLYKRWFQHTNVHMKQMSEGFCDASQRGLGCTYVQWHVSQWIDTCKCCLCDAEEHQIWTL